jgi:hypothetical protein
MNKFVASVGLVAVSASALQAASIPGFDDTVKPWSVSATLRGFYDDNRGTAPSGRDRLDSFGIEFSPSVGVVFPWEGTTLSAGYVYSYKWYDRALSDGGGHSDQTHDFHVMLDHNFSERYNLNIRDSFVVGQEPDSLRTGSAFTTFQRISGNNIRNDGSIAFRAQITPLIGLELGYGNEYFDYDDAGGQAGAPSFSGLLDRIENKVHLDSRWNVLPDTVAVAGYQFRDASYTGDEEIGATTDPRLPSVRSDNRNFREHYFYVGAEQVFNPQLTASVRIGLRYIDYYNDPTGNGNGWGPYAMANVRWTYAPESYVELGLTHDMNATDVVGAGNDGQGISSSYTASQETTSIFGSVNHKITPKLRASLIGQFQNSSFNGGSLGGSAESYYLVGLNFNYQFTRHFSAEMGYNYDNLESDIAGRSFDRNRVYIGVTGSY